MMADRQLPNAASAGSVAKVPGFIWVLTGTDFLPDLEFQAPPPPPDMMGGFDDFLAPLPPPVDYDSHAPPNFKEKGAV